MQLIGSGMHGPKAAVAVRQTAAQQGVWSLGNFGGMPPQAIVSSILPMQQISSSSPQQQQPTPQPTPCDASHPTKIDDGDYRSIFNSCGVGIAIASMGGGFVDCNPLFCSVSNYTKQELCAQTIFNLTERQDLQRAFDMICRMLAPTSTTTQEQQQPEIVVLRGAMKNRGGVGLGVSLVKGENGIPKCFCVTLVKNPSSSDLDDMTKRKPIPIACDQIFLQQAAAAQSGHDFSSKSNNMAGFAPTFTAG
jgi:PAS domain-containing protein